MARKLVLVAVVGLACAAGAVSADDAKPAAPEPAKAKVDKARVFEKLDADADGKVTKDEFKKLKSIRCTLVFKKTKPKED